MTLGFGLQALGHLVEDVGRLMHPAALLAGLPINLAQRLPKPERAVAHGQTGACLQPPALEVEQQFPPALWSCPCLVERRWLSFGHNGLECDRRLIAERGVASGWIVEAVDVTANGVFGVLSGLESGPPDEF